MTTAVINQIYEFGPFRVDAVKRLLLRDGQPVPLTPKAFELLLTLVQNRGRVLKKDELLQKVWSGIAVEENNLSVNISALRKSLGETPNEHRYVVTVPGQGYSFVAPVKELMDESAGSILSDVTVLHDIAREETCGETDVIVKPELEPVNDVVSATSFITTTPVTQNLARKQQVRSLKWLAVLLIAAISLSVVIWFTVFHRTSESPVSSLRIKPATSYPGREFHPDFSPDGNQLAFSWDGEKGDNVDVYVKLIDEGTPLRLTTDTADDICPVWSPDNRQIAFVRRFGDGQREGIYLISSLGGTERKVAEIAANRYGSRPRLSWSADGKFLATIDKSSQEELSSIYLLSIETGEKRKLTSPSREFIGDSCPAFSPDGQILALIRSSSESVEDIYLLPVAAGGEPKRLTFDNALLSTLAWTADGRQIIFSSTREGISSLWKISASGGTPERLTAVGLNAVQPAVSRRGNRLAYTQVLLDSNIWRVEIPSSHNKATSSAMLISSTRLDISPQYSPDGKSIAFQSDRLGSIEIWMCDSEGANPVQLTSMGGLTAAPRWSPDSRHIVFDSRSEGNVDIFAVGVEDRRPRRLTTDPAEDTAPSWSRNGQWIYFSSNRSGQLQVWKMPARGGQVVQVTKHGGFEAIESPDGKYIYYVRGRDRSGIWRVSVEGGDETPALDFHKAGYLHYWDVVEEGIYFATSETSPRPTIQFFSFTTGKLVEVFKFEKRPLIAYPGLTVSPDKRWILYAQADQHGRDIMLVDNFR